MNIPTCLRCEQQPVSYDSRFCWEHENKEREAREKLDDAIRSMDDLIRDATANNWDRVESILIDAKVKLLAAREYRNAAAKKRLHPAAVLPNRSEE